MYYNRTFYWLGPIVLLAFLLEFVTSEQCSFEGELRETTVGQRTDVIQVCFDRDGDGVMEWTFICFNNWGKEEADLVCRRAGYLFADYNGLGESFDRGAGIVKLTDVSCTDNSMSLLDCTYITTVQACNYVAAILSSCRKCDHASNCNGGICDSSSECQCVGGCMNGGFCFVGKCICPDGYSGINCEANSPATTEQMDTSVMSTASTVVQMNTESELSSSIPTSSIVDCLSVGNNGVNCTTNKPISQNDASNINVIVGLVISLCIVSSIAVILFVVILIVAVAVAHTKSSSKPTENQEQLSLSEEVACPQLYESVNIRYSEPYLYSSISEPNFYHTIVSQTEEIIPYEEVTHFRPTSIITDDYIHMVGGAVIDPKFYDQLPRHNSTQKNQLREYVEPPNNLPELKSMLDTCLHEISEADIEIGEEFASGHFGMVYRGNYHTGKGDIPVAIKTLKEKGVTDTDKKLVFMREAAILAQFHHPNVLRLIGILTGTHQPWMIVTELLKTELRQFLLNIKLTPADPSTPDKLQIQNLLLKFSREIAAGMQHLAEKKFIHRDLAARNVLVAKDMSVRVADFGMSREIDNENDYYTSSGGRVPLRWTAPEALFYKKFSEKSDVWSFGMTLYEIWSLGVKPWQGYENEEILEALSTGHTLSQPVNCPIQVYQVMLDTWYQEPKMRRKFSEITVALNNIKYCT